jgi:hypothetical protein
MQWLLYQNIRLIDCGVYFLGRPYGLVMHVLTEADLLPKGLIPFSHLTLVRHLSH